MDCLGITAEALQLMVVPDSVAENNDFSNAKNVSLIFANNVRYDGGIVNGIREGFGTLRLPDGTKYAGMFERGLPNKTGQIFWPDGSHYEGEILDGLRHGIGKMIHKFDDQHGSVYMGSWAHGKRSGTGTLYYNLDCTGPHYTGQWENDMRHGLGAVYFENGDSYAGEWKNDKKCGLGRMVWMSNGICEEYVGNWFEDLPHGQGVHTWYRSLGSHSKRTMHTGSHGEDDTTKEDAKPTRPFLGAPIANRYRGEFWYGFRHGTGVFFYGNGSKYIGEWFQNKKHGFGVYVSSDGNVFEAAFQADLPVTNTAQLVASGFLSQEQLQNEISGFSVDRARLEPMVPRANGDSPPSSSQHTPQRSPTPISTRPPLPPAFQPPSSIEPRMLASDSLYTLQIDDLLPEDVTLLRWYVQNHPSRAEEELGKDFCTSVLSTRPSRKDTSAPDVPNNAHLFGPHVHGLLLASSIMAPDSELGQEMRRAHRVINRLRSAASSHVEAALLRWNTKLLGWYESFCTASWFDPVLFVNNQSHSSQNVTILSPSLHVGSKHPSFQTHRSNAPPVNNTSPSLYKIDAPEVVHTSTAAASAPTVPRSRRVSSTLTEEPILSSELTPNLFSVPTNEEIISSDAHPDPDHPHPYAEQSTHSLSASPALNLYYSRVLLGFEMGDPVTHSTHIPEGHTESDHEHPTDHHGNTQGRRGGQEYSPDSAIPGMSSTADGDTYNSGRDTGAHKEVLRMGQLLRFLIDTGLCQPPYATLHTACEILQEIRSRKVVSTIEACNKLYVLSRFWVYSPQNDQQNPHEELHHDHHDVHSQEHGVDHNELYGVSAQGDEQRYTDIAGRDDVAESLTQIPTLQMEYIADDMSTSEAGEYNPHTSSHDGHSVQEVHVSHMGSLHSDASSPLAEVSTSPSVSSVNPPHAHPTVTSPPIASPATEPSQELDPARKSSLDRIYEWILRDATAQLHAVWDPAAPVFFGEFVELLVRLTHRRAKGISRFGAWKEANLRGSQWWTRKATELLQTQLERENKPTRRTRRSDRLEKERMERERLEKMEMDTQKHENAQRRMKPSGGYSPVSDRGRRGNAPGVSAGGLEHSIGSFHAYGYGETKTRDIVAVTSSSALLGAPFEQQALFQWRRGNPEGLAQLVEAVFLHQVETLTLRIFSLDTNEPTTITGGRRSLGSAGSMRTDRTGGISHTAGSRVSSARKRKTPAQLHVTYSRRSPWTFSTHISREHNFQIDLQKPMPDFTWNTCPIRYCLRTNVFVPFTVWNPSLPAPPDSHTDIKDKGSPDTGHFGLSSYAFPSILTLSYAESASSIFHSASDVSPNAQGMDTSSSPNPMSIDPKESISIQTALRYLLWKRKRSLFVKLNRGLSPTKNPIQHRLKLPTNVEVELTLSPYKEAPNLLQAAYHPWSTMRQAYTIPLFRSFLALDTPYVTVSSLVTYLFSSGLIEWNVERIPDAVVERILENSSKDVNAPDTPSTPSHHAYSAADSQSSRSRQHHSMSSVSGSSVLNRSSGTGASSDLDDKRRTGKQASPGESTSPGKSLPPVSVIQSFPSDLTQPDSAEVGSSTPKSKPTNSSVDPLSSQSTLTSRLTDQSGTIVFTNRSASSVVQDAASNFLNNVSTAFRRLRMDLLELVRSFPSFDGVTVLRIIFASLQAAPPPPHLLFLTDPKLVSSELHGKFSPHQELWGAAITPSQIQIWGGTLNANQGAGTGIGKDTSTGVTNARSAPDTTSQTPALVPMSPPASGSEAAPNRVSTPSGERITIAAAAARVINLQRTMSSVNTAVVPYEDQLAIFASGDISRAASTAVEQAQAPLATASSAVLTPPSIIVPVRTALDAGLTPTSPHHSSSPPVTPASSPRASSPGQSSPHAHIRDHKADEGGKPVRYERIRVGDLLQTKLTPLEVEEIMLRLATALAAIQVSRLAFIAGAEQRLNGILNTFHFAIEKETKTYFQRLSIRRVSEAMSPPAPSTSLPPAAAQSSGSQTTTGTTRGRRGSKQHPASNASADTTSKSKAGASSSGSGNAATSSTSGTKQADTTGLSVPVTSSGPPRSSSTGGIYSDEQVNQIVRLVTSEGRSFAKNIAQQVSVRFRLAAAESVIGSRVPPPTSVSPSGTTHNDTVDSAKQDSKPTSGSASDDDAAPSQSRPQAHTPPSRKGRPRRRAQSSGIAQTPEDIVVGQEVSTGQTESATSDADAESFVFPGWKSTLPGGGVYTGPIPPYLCPVLTGKLQDFAQGTEVQHWYKASNDGDSAETSGDIGPPTPRMHRRSPSHPRSGSGRGRSIAEGSQVTPMHPRYIPTVASIHEHCSELLHPQNTNLMEFANSGLVCFFEKMG